MDPSSRAGNRAADIAAISTVRLWCRSGRARQIREAAGLNGVETAELVPTFPQNVYRWEQADRLPSAENAVRYHRALVKLQELAGQASA